MRGYMRTEWNAVFWRKVYKQGAKNTMEGDIGAVQEDAEGYRWWLSFGTVLIERGRSESAQDAAKDCDTAYALRRQT